jgi:glycerol-3-phosphate acyltransferase PlsY
MRISRIVSLSSMLAALLLPAWCALWLPWPATDDPGTPVWPIVATGMLGVLVCLTHRANIRRLIAGTEPRVGVARPADTIAA